MRSPTLFARTFALLAALMLASVLSWHALFAYFEREPKAALLAQSVSSTVNLVRPALLAAEPRHRASLLRALAEREGIRIYPAFHDDVLTALPDSALMNRVLQKVSEQLGPRTRFAQSVDGIEGFWVSFDIDRDDEYWLMMPADRIAPKTPQAWLGWATLGLMLALGGAWAIVAHLTRPLSRLARAARALGRGERGERLDESGPPELADVARAFNQMSSDLAHIEADRAMSLAGVSHDLRTPLARLRLEIELAGLPEESATAMTGDIDEMDAIIGQFLDYARDPDSEQLDVIDLPALINSLIKSFARRGVIITCDAPATLSVPARPLALRRALGNLVQNALRYAGAQHPIELALRGREREIEIDIMDRGPGIDARDAETLKRAFVRGQAARTGASGAGLGLAIVERIARSHGGSLALMNREGGGLIARITLPRTPLGQ